jgi:hypothetical protein
MKQEMRDAQQAFDSTMESRTQRAAQLQAEIDTFNPTAYVEKCELEELRTMMQHSTVLRPTDGNSHAARANLRTFQYTEGAGWASNAPEKRPPPPAPVVAVPQPAVSSTPPPEDGMAIPEPSSVKLLRKLKVEDGDGKAPAQQPVATSPTAGSPTTSIPEGIEDAVADLPAPPAPSRRLEKALSAYKEALSQRQGPAAKQHQARLRRFLAGEF